MFGRFSRAADAIVAIIAARSLRDMKILESARQRERHALAQVADVAFERGGNVLLGFARRDAAIVA